MSFEEVQMTLSLMLLATAASAAESEIVVTASRIPIDAEAAPVSSALFDQAEIDALSLPGAADLLRLSPGVAVANTGPRGTQAQLRIRGAEANHTLLFLDGIRLNDPAAGNEARFELLTTALLSAVAGVIVGAIVAFAIHQISRLKSGH